MPRLSDSMEEGTILQWLKQVGDEVAVGDELVEIETDKANMAYESDVAGTLTEILAEEGTTLPIGTPIARVGDSAEGSERSAAGPDELRRGLPSVLGPRSLPPAASARIRAAGSSRAASAPADRASREPRPSSAASDGEEADGRPKASPLARRMAKEKGWTWRRCRARGPAGGSSRRTSRRRRPGRPRRPAELGERRAHRRPPGRRRPAAGRTALETAKGEVSLRGALQAPGDGRPPDGGVEGDGAALLPARPRST